MATNLQPSNDLKRTFKKVTTNPNLQTFTPVYSTGEVEGDGKASHLNTELPANLEPFAPKEDPEIKSMADLESAYLLLHLKPIPGNWNAPAWVRAKRLIKACGRGYGFRVTNISTIPAPGKKPDES